MRDIDAIADELRRCYGRTHRQPDRVMREQGVSFARTRLLMFLEQRGVRSAGVAGMSGHARPRGGWAS